MKKNNFLSKLIPLSLGIILLFHQSLFSNPNELNIGFGSCLDQDMSFEIFEKVIDQNPNYFIFMGDNIYLDSENPEEKIPAYKKFTENKKFLKLKKNTKLFFTWDDHDFGVNDAGNDYKEIEKSKEIFLKYIEEPNDSPRRKRKGVYDSYMVNFASKKIQIILLDTRTFRSPIKSRFWGFGSYIPNTDPGATVLGKEQWEWLETELKKGADLKLIVSSIQFHNDYHRFEKWGNFPLEKEKLYNIIKRNNLKGILILSGDRHIGEFHVIKKENLPLIYEVTSSPLNKELTFPAIEPFHPDRIGNFVQESNFGLLKLKKIKNEIFISMEIHLLNGSIMKKEIKLKDLY